MAEESTPQEDPPVNPIWKPDYDREPKWKDMSEDDLELFYERVKGYLNENGEIDNLDWSRLNFDIVDADFYEERIGPGFPREFYELLAKSTNEENKIQDYRQLPLDINRGEVTLTFSNTKTDEKEESI
jgi:hypothetical protein